MISRSMTVELMTDQDGSVFDAQPNGKHGTTSPTIMKVEKDPRALEDKGLEGDLVLELLQPITIITW